MQKVSGGYFLTHTVYLSNSEFVGLCADIQTWAYAGMGKGDLPMPGNVVKCLCISRQCCRKSQRTKYKLFMHYFQNVSLSQGFAPRLPRITDTGPRWRISVPPDHLIWPTLEKSWRHP